jgi:hypothetical protein
MGFFKKFFKKIFNPIVKIVKKIVSAVIKPIVDLTEGFLGLFGMSFDMPEMPSPENFDAVQQGILVNKQSNVANIPIVYGTRKIGGTRVFVGSASTDNKYLYVCLAVCEGEIDSFTKLWINDEEQKLDSFATGAVRSILSTNAKGEASSYHKTTPRAKFQFFTGTDSQTESSLLQEHGDWTGGNHRLRGIAYVACRFEWVKAEHVNGEQTVFNPWSGIPNIQVEIKGKKVLASEKYAASAGSGIVTIDQTADTSTYSSTISSFAFSDNPADCLMDYLRNPRYGKALNNNRISFADFKAAAGTCDIDKDFGGGTDGVGTADFMICNAVISTSDSVLSNTKKLLQSCRGFMPYTDGKYRLKIEANESTSGIQVITDDHIVSPITIASIDKNSRYNMVKVTFSNSKKDYESDTVIYQNATYKTEDGGEDLILNVSAPSITERERAFYHGKYLVDRSRKALTISFSMTNEGQNIRPGDLVKLTHKFKREGEDTGTYEHMFENKVLRCLEISLNYDSTVDVNFVEHDTSADSVSSLAVDGSVSAGNNTNPPSNNQGNVDAANKNATVDVSTLITGSTARIIFRTNNTDALANKLQIEYRLNGDTMTYASTIENFGDGIDYTVMRAGSNEFKPGDKIKFRLNTRRNNVFGFLRAGTVFIGGTATGSTFTQNYSNGWT